MPKRNLEPHAYHRIQAAIKDGDEETARRILHEEEFSGRARIALDQAIKRAFTTVTPAKGIPHPKDDVELTEVGTSTAEALERRNSERRERAREKAERSKPSIGWNVQPKEGVEYRTPNPAGRNLP